MLVALFGPDGAGKTSIATGLKGSNRIVWIRGTHTLASVIARFLARFSLFRGNDNPYFKLSIPCKMHCLWAFIEFVSILPYALSRFILLPKFRNVIAERSIPDFIVWVATTLKEPDFVDSFIGSFLLTLCRRQDMLIYVTASLEELARRRPESIAFIKRQLPIYETLAKRLKAPRLDTTAKTVRESILASRVITD